jgi:Protein-tyrosine phosphatase
MAAGSNRGEAGRATPERHVHRTRVVFEDGTTVTGVSFVGDDPYGRDVPPSFGLYLDERWSPPWPHAHVDWPDFSVPRDIEVARSALVQLVERARQGESVEVGCLGGHGRTGTALACIAVLTGTSATEAVTWIRANYCSQAVETGEQATFASNFAS